MELLAPAGNREQGIAAIKGGCSAVYGGLKKWSARYKAVNFELDEYLEFLTICHSANVKFYLALNALLKDYEIEEIIELFKSKTFKLPDAVIVADLGLLSALHMEFPDLPIHISTQQGASTADEVLFYEKLGVKRVILARELTIGEISKIREYTHIELEVFAYGAQCIAYSGYCYWSKFMYNGCGNIGNCSGPCWKQFETFNNKKEPFYLGYMDNAEFITQLIRMGINSIKIEGRLRSTEEIKKITEKYNLIIKNGETTRNIYLPGFISGLRNAQDAYQKVQLNRKISHINDCCKIFQCINVEKYLPQIDSVTFETDNLNILLYMQEIGIKKFIYTITNFKELKELSRKIHDETDIIYKVPILDFNNKQEELFHILKNSKVMLTKISQTFLADKIGLDHEKVFFDHTANIWNSKTLKFLIDIGYHNFTASTELCFEENMNILKHSGIEDVQFIVWGRLPIGFTRICFKNYIDCDRWCETCRSYKFGYSKEDDYSINIMCKKEFGYREIIPECYFVSAFTEKIENVRVSLLGMKLDEVQHIIKKKCKLKTKCILI